jgi:hypothetical protein
MGTITKLEAAHGQLTTAIHLYFDDGDLAAVHTLACAAREIYEKHCKAAGVPRMFDYIESAHPTRKQKELWNILNGPRNFLKHPENDFDLSASITLDDDMNASMLFMAGHDCAILCKDKQPPAVQAFSLWFMATKFPLDFEDTEPEAIQAREIAQRVAASYPGLREARIADQKRIGKGMLIDALRLASESKQNPNA